MNTQSYSQQAVVWLRKLIPWWRLLNRKAIVRKIDSLLKTAQEELETVTHAFDIEKYTHEETRTKFHDVQLKLTTEQASHERTQDELKTTLTKLELITHTLGATTEEHPKCKAFRKFLEEFVKFANDENLFEREADAILRLQAVEEEMRLLGRVPLFRKKTIIAVAGGFSSGKSSLITSFFDPQFKVTLPIGMDPVTAIPTYIAADKEPLIIGFPAHGGTLNIAAEVFAQMNHEFLASLGFDLRRILPFIMLATPWQKDWERLCFIDTPGYNAPGMNGHIMTADNKTTAEALQLADALLWVIGLDSNGEISTTDLEYVQNHALNLPLAVVINKADQRPPSHVHAVIEQIQETLDAYGIEYHCISAYSSIEGKEYEYIGQPLEEFIGYWNQQSVQRDNRLRDEVLQVIDEYMEAFDKEISHRFNNGNELHSLMLDLHELGLFDELDESTTGFLDNTRRNEVKNKSRERMQALSRLFAIDKIESHKKEAMRLREEATNLFKQNWD